MRKNNIITVFILFITFMTYIGYGQISKGSQAMSTTEEQHVMETILRMTHAFHEQNLAGVMGCYAEDAVVIFEPGKPIRGEALRERFAMAFGMKPSFEYGGHEVFVAGQTAVHLAPWTMTATAPDGSQIEDRGLSVAVLRRQTDGQWLMVIDYPYGSHLEKQP